MRRSLFFLSTSLLHHRRHFSSSSSSSSPTLHSFLQPSIFPHRKPNSPKPSSPPPPPPPSPSPETQTSLESSLLSALNTHQTDEAWRCFKALTASSLLPSSPSLSNSLIAHLLSLSDRLALKRAFAASIYLLERSPLSLSPPTSASLFQSFAAANTLPPALALFRAMVKHRVFPPFTIWGPAVMQMAKKNNANFRAFLGVFEENCEAAMEEGMESMRPDLGACNAVLDGCCKILNSVSDAEKVLEVMSGLDLAPDSNTFGSLAYLYAFTGNERRIDELDKLMDALDYSNKTVFFTNIISGYVKSGAFELIPCIVLRALQEHREDESNVFDHNTYTEIVNCFIENGKTKDLAALIVRAQELEAFSERRASDRSVGYGIVSACVELGHLEKAHNVLDEMSAHGASITLHVYSCILKAYCKEQRTVEAMQLVAEINSAGLQLDSPMYDALIDSSMTKHDFESAFSLFKQMREAMLPELKTSYLTIMTGLTENNRPDLMAAFLDSVVDDPRVRIATHDWNSIVHSFCKVGRLEEAKRTYKRMVFLRFEPSNQTYLSLINGFVTAEKYFDALMLWKEVRRNNGAEFNRGLIDAFLYALVKGGFFDAAMEVVEKANELRIFVDKWRHKQAFMEKHKKLKVAKLRKRSYRKMEAFIAFKNWAGLNT